MFVCMYRIATIPMLCHLEACMCRYVFACRNREVSLDESTCKYKVYACIYSPYIYTHIYIHVYTCCMHIYCMHMYMYT